jgi:predicted RNA-binding protein YlxR (DUF448 family)
MRPSIRTCVGCRQRGPASEMVRLRVEDGRVTVATSRIASGRGASVHPRPACMMGALKPGVLARAFKRPVVAAESAAFLKQLTVASRNRKLGTP